MGGGAVWDSWRFLKSVTYRPTLGKFRGGPVKKNHPVHPAFGTWMSGPLKVIEQHCTVLCAVAKVFLLSLELQSHWPSSQLLLSSATSGKEGWRIRYFVGVKIWLEELQVSKEKEELGGRWKWLDSLSNEKSRRGSWKLGDELCSLLWRSEQSWRRGRRE